MKKMRLLFSFLLIAVMCTACGNAGAETMTETVQKETEEMTVSETEIVTEQETETIAETESEAETEKETVIETEKAFKQKPEPTVQPLGRVLPKQEDTTEAVTETVSETETELPVVSVSNLQISTISVSCLKVMWDLQEGREYDVSVETEAPYQENIYLYFKEKNLLYLTGLRENSEYTVYVSPKANEGETAQPETVTGHTEQVNVVYNFDEDEEAYAQYKDSGVLYATDFFAGERASGLTAQPASGAIAGSIKDPVYDTSIRVDEYGDFCVAMGQYFGQDWDRYLITMQNGQQFTVKQCDDKGLRWYHEIGEDDTNRNIIEFIYDSDANVPSGVKVTGTWGSFFWNGLAFSHIQSIQKIEYPENPIEY